MKKTEATFNDVKSMKSLYTAVTIIYLIKQSCVLLDLSENKTYFSYHVKLALLLIGTNIKT